MVERTGDAGSPEPAGHGGGAAGGLARARPRRSRAHGDVEAVRESERRLRRLVETVDVVPWEVDLTTGRRTYVGPQAEHLLGYPLEDWYAPGFWSSHLHPDDRERVLALTRDPAHRPARSDLEYRLIAADGRAVWVRDIVTVAREGDPPTMSGFILDISERKRALSELQESEERYRSVVDAMQEGVLMQLADGTIAACNRSAERIIGRRADELIGQSAFGWTALHPDGSTFTFETLPQTVTLRTGQPCSGVVLGFYRPDGELRWASVNCQPLTRPGDPRAYAAVATFADITERRAMEHVRNEFVTIASHELRTPLTAIKGFVDLLLDGAAGELNPEQTEFMSIIQNGADQMVGLIDSLLDLARLNSGDVTLDRTSLDIGRQVREAAAVLTARIEAKGQRLTLRDLDGLSPVFADPGRLRQILSHLIVNAHKFTPREGSITVSARAAEDRLWVQVQDTGPGLTPDERSQIFVAFYRPPNPATQGTRGSGIGLAVTRALVHLHGGEILVTSTPGAGSTFSFSLPLVSGAHP